MRPGLSRLWLLALPAVSGAAVAAVGQPAGEAARVPEPMGVGSLVQLTLGMIAVLALIVGIAWLLKRTGRFHNVAGSNLRVLGGLSMGARERVILLQVGETQLLVGVTPGSVTPLHVLDRPLETPAAATGDNAGFAGQLNRLLNGGQPG